MSTRTITGNLAADPEVVQAGSIQITKLRVIENTGEYRQGTWQAQSNATTSVSTPPPGAYRRLDGLGM